MHKKSAAPGVIYFLEAEGIKRIKIGFSTNFPNRLSDLQGASPVKLRVLKIVKGAQETERLLIRVFGVFRIHGEWFDAHHSLVQFIKELPESQLFSPEMLVKNNFARSKK